MLIGLSMWLWMPMWIMGVALAIILATKGMLAISSAAFDYLRKRVKDGPVRYSAGSTEALWMDGQEQD